MKIFPKFFSILLIWLLVALNTYAQNSVKPNYFRDIILNVDTSSFSLSRNTIYIKGERHIYFQYQNDQEVCEINLFPHDLGQIDYIRFHNSGDFDILDSLLIIDQEYIRTKVRFKNITKSNFFNFTFTIEDAETGKAVVQEVKIFPVTETYVKFYPEDNELYIGEEKVIELVTNKIENIKINQQWTSGEEIDYRFSERNGQLRIHLLPNSLGKKTVETKFETLKPYLNEQKQLNYHYPNISNEFLVKSSRLGFLNIDKKEVTYIPGSTEPIEVQLDNSRFLQLNKTYRIENQEQPGGALIAELFTRSSLSNDRVLCNLRVYAYHKKTDGYLYIKEGDFARFITNLSITPVANINRISILREGGDWTQNLNVQPGETVDVRIEGQGLHKANFHFDGAEKVASDSLIMNENLIVHKIRVPMNINKNKINIHNNTENTGQSLSVKEFQQPHPLNFVAINYGAGDKPIIGLNRTILYDRSISDVVLSFRPELLDAGNRLHGKQYLEVEIRLSGPRNELIEMKMIEDIVVCPADNSPRFAYYADKQCNQGDTNLNNFLSRKTYNLDDWSRIQLIIRHKKDRYGGEGFTERVEIVLQRHSTFDIDVSFPAGLITRTVGSDGFDPLGGISMAMIAQFSFFRPNKIAQYRPYRIGMGFIALDAFNFTPPPVVNGQVQSNRDVGIVVLGTLYPARRDVKLSFPLNLGGGYKMQDGRFFFLIGPGIRVRL
ncbi:hypothetical protein BH23BAC1_BH23BAC1_10040 [soil metagenome]